ncbi:MAG: alpha/beta hydrolase [Candidatus Rokubacteria bacterium]|nr:alpha/beta hydrolase [Candidatus Rokubacteria bacterium]
MPEPWSHRVVEANGLRFHCVTAGEGPLVVLLHGFPEFWYSWRYQIPALARAGFTVLAPDLRGYNDSDKPEGIEAYRIGSIVEDIAGLIRALGHERAGIVGHDWGGAAAYAFAMLHPEMTVRLAVLNCPHPDAFTRALRDGNQEQLKKSWYMFFFQFPGAPEELLSANNFRFLKEFAYANARKGTFPPPVLREYVAAMAKPGALTGSINWYRAMFRRGLPALREYPKISAPTLVIWGSRDHFLGQELTRGMRRNFSGPFRIAYLPGVSHWVQQEAPDRVNRLLIDFFKAPQKKLT